MVPTSKDCVVPLPTNSTFETFLAMTLGKLAALIASTRPATVLLAGTAISKLLMRTVSPAVSTGLAMVEVVIPYCLL